jgi:hypothetical protein
MKFIKSTAGRLVAAFVVAVLGVVGVIAVSNAAVKPDCKNLMYPLCARSVAAGQVVDNSLPGYKKLAPGSVSEDRLNTATRAKLNDTTGRVNGVESDGPYPGRTDEDNNLQNIDGGSQGAQSTQLWSANDKRQSSWVMCAPGKVALGGGFGDNDADDSKIRVVTSSPVQIAKDGDTYKLTYNAIDGDKAGSFVPNGWLVEGYNEGTAATVVRPHVICAKIG